MLLFTKDLSRNLQQNDPDVNYATFDPRVGAVGRPNVHINDMWGQPGVYLRTNSQGFRNSEDFAARRPRDRLRVICSGDSYTMGQGVSNDDAWCAKLTTIDPRLETVNMGQSGYGLDNAYLRFRHYGRPLQHDVHLFAFITADLYRMQEPWTWPWQRSLLQVRDDRLVIPEQIDCFPCRHSWAPALLVALRGLRAAEVFDRLGRRSGLMRAVNQDSIIAVLAGHVIEDLAAMAAADSSSLVLLHLPALGDAGSDRAAKWQRWLGRTAANHNIPYINLIQDLQQLDPQTLDGFFLAAKVDRGRHYTAAGHTWVAEQVYGSLINMPTVARRVLDLEPQGIETGGR
jgi:hypothetical protein